MLERKELTRKAKSQLIELAKARGINTSGKKDFLIEAILKFESRTSSADNISKEDPGVSRYDLEGMTRADLQKFAKSLDLKTTGKKAELLERILSAQTKDDAISYATESPPEPDPTAFCCIHREIFTANDAAPAGFAILKSAVVYLHDTTTNKDHLLKIPVEEAKSNLPPLMTDNVVCRNCLDRNRAMGLFDFMKKTAPNCAVEQTSEVNEPLSSQQLLGQNFVEDFSSNQNPQYQDLNDISVISVAAEEVLALLDDLDSAEISSTSDSIPPEQGIDSSPTIKLFRKIEHRKPINPPLAVKLAQRRISQKIVSSQIAKQQREKKAMANRELCCVDNDSLTDEDSFSSTASSSSKSSLNLKLPAPAKERKARGETLWKAPSRSNSALGKTETTYIPVEDKNIAEKVVTIMEQTKPGSLEEWKLISGGSCRALRRSP